MSPSTFIIENNVQNANSLFIRCKFVSLGRDQAHTVQAQLTEAVKHGHWIVFENCDLMPEWMSALECLYIGQMKSDHVHDDFRWWFIIDAIDTFPLVILRDAVKFVHQHPPGVSENMRVQYENGLVDEGEADSITMRPKWYRFAYALNAFHAIANERNRYGAIGWSAGYEFNETLLIDAVSYLQRMLKQCDDLPYNEFFYLISDCLYANEIVDQNDRRLLDTLLRCFCTEKVLNEENYVFFESGQLNVPTDTQPSNCVQHLRSIMCSAADVGLHENDDYRRSVRDGQNVRHKRAVFTKMF